MLKPIFLLHQQTSILIFANVAGRLLYEHHYTTDKELSEQVHIVFKLSQGNVQKQSGNRGKSEAYNRLGKMKKVSKFKGDDYLISTELRLIKATRWHQITSWPNKTTCENLCRILFWSQQNGTVKDLHHAIVSTSKPNWRRKAEHKDQQNIDARDAAAVCRIRCEIHFALNCVAMYQIHQPQHRPELFTLLEFL